LSFTGEACYNEGSPSFRKLEPKKKKKKNLFIVYQRRSLSPQKIPSLRESIELLSEEARRGWSLFPARNLPYATAETKELLAKKKERHPHGKACPVWVSSSSCSEERETRLIETPIRTRASLLKKKEGLWNRGLDDGKKELFNRRKKSGFLVSLRTKKTPLPGKSSSTKETLTEKETDVTKKRLCCKKEGRANADPRNWGNFLFRGERDSWKA